MDVWVKADRCCSLTRDHKGLFAGSLFSLMGPVSELLMVLSTYAHSSRQPISRAPVRLLEQGAYSNRCKCGLGSVPHSLCQGVIEQSLKQNIMFCCNNKYNGSTQSEYQGCGQCRSILKLDKYDFKRCLEVPVIEAAGSQDTVGNEDENETSVIQLFSLQYSCCGWHEWRVEQNTFEPPEICLITLNHGTKRQHWWTCVLCPQVI